jgi:hypothetical protein
MDKESDGDMGVVMELLGEWKWMKAWKWCAQLRRECI